MRTKFAWIVISSVALAFSSVLVLPAFAANPTVTSSDCTTLVPPTVKINGLTVQPPLVTQCFVVWSDGTRCATSFTATLSGYSGLAAAGTATGPVYLGSGGTGTLGTTPTTLQCAFSGVVGVP